MIIECRTRDGTTRRMAEYRETMAWARYHMDVSESRTLEILRCLHRSGATSALFEIAALDRPHLIAINRGVIVTWWLDEPGAARAWRADGTLPGFETVNVIIPADPEWSTGRMADVMPGPLRVVPVACPAAGVRIDRFGFFLGWRCVEDRDPLPHVTVCREGRIRVPRGVLA